MYVILNDSRLGSGIIFKHFLIMEVPIYHVTYQDLKKRISAHNEELYPKIEDEFHVSLDDHYLYMFDTDFDDWVTIDKPADVAVLCGKGKLMLKKKNQGNIINVFILYGIV